MKETTPEQKQTLPTDTLLRMFIGNLKAGYHRVESKADGDKIWTNILTKFAVKGETEAEREAIKEHIKKCGPPIVNNYEYSFGNTGYTPVEFSITKINRVYGFRRHDTGEYGNFTIVKDSNGGYTYKIQPLDDFNIPEWTGGLAQLE